MSSRFAVYLGHFPRTGRLVYLDVYFGRGRGRLKEPASHLGKLESWTPHFRSGEKAWYSTALPVFSSSDFMRGPDPSLFSSPHPCSPFPNAKVSHESHYQQHVIVPRGAFTLTVQSLLAAANLVAERSKHTALRGCCPASRVPISATIRGSQSFTTPSASQDPTLHQRRRDVQGEHESKGSCSSTSDHDRKPRDELSPDGRAPGDATAQGAVPYSCTAADGSLSLPFPFSFSHRLRAQQDILATTAGSYSTFPDPWMRKITTDSNSHRYPRGSLFCCWLYGADVDHPLSHPNPGDGRLDFPIETRLTSPNEVGQYRHSIGYTYIGPLTVL